VKISKKARDNYRFPPSFFNIEGKVVFPDFQAARQFAEQLEETEARAGHLNAMGLMCEIFAYLIELYQEQENPGVLEKALTWLDKKLGTGKVNSTLRLFAEEFPPETVYRGESSPEEYMTGETGGVSHRQVLLQELLLLRLANMNPAREPYKKVLFEDSSLVKRSAYESVYEYLELFFQSQPFFGPIEQNLVAMLRSPAIAVPDSLTGQLNYIRDNWGALLGDFLARLLAGLDLIKEEEKFGGQGPGETPVLDFSGASLDDEYERFSADKYWMPRLVLMAKSTYVWLDQLSKKYQSHIQRLDQVPDEELDLLARQGFTGLWLIGVWQRSRASERIKQICGNPEAMASAYSIYNYRIAEDLGGQEALDNLKHRAWQRGIRMASDMVPNHMGIDSPWVVEHPDWFLYLDHCPYPSYSFNGPNLSSDDRVSIFLEDHYYDRTDAAVVFKWVDNHSGEVRYIYHGNDGTSMPWNDTAQLNYLNPEVREAVAGTIFSVAGMFPVIRFDAAMTLSKKHYQRLWFPEPGSGGDIPTRAGMGMTQGEFLQHMPEEFWRQVVDRFSEAQSDTLLLAEAFWLMEAYFVRTLGMHRVYNSAFMNFLKNEDNGQFRTSIKNVLQFNREILKRFVNFMNNPDEETAVAQFGKDDKYFGVCTLMATMPGLPMFGHGQIEGFVEKYGMEYRRAYHDEELDTHLLERHEREIFPLLRQRYLFAHVDHFLLYDFFTPEGYVNEDVIAYSNRWENDRSLVIYHNRFAETAGWLKTSVPFTVNTGDAPEQKSLADGLELAVEENRFVIFRDQNSGLQYIRSCGELREKGLYIELKAFKKYVFLEFYEVTDSADALYARVAAMLEGRGVPSVEDTLRRHFLNPLREPFREYLQPGTFQGFSEEYIEETGTKLQAVLEAAKQLTGSSSDTAEIARSTCRELEPVLNSETRPRFKPATVVMLTVRALEKIAIQDRPPECLDSILPWLEDWLLTDDIRDFINQWEVPDETALQWPEVIRVTLRFPWWRQIVEKRKTPTAKTQIKNGLDSFFDDPDVRQMLKVNRHNDILWFHIESAREWFDWMVFVYGNYGTVPALYPGESESVHDSLQSLPKLSGYRWEILKDMLVLFCAT
jgi:glycosidase